MKAIWALFAFSIAVVGADLERFSAKNLMRVNFICSHADADVVESAARKELRSFHDILLTDTEPDITINFIVAAVEPLQSRIITGYAVASFAFEPLAIMNLTNTLGPRVQIHDVEGADTNKLYMSSAALLKPFAGAVQPLLYRVDFVERRHEQERMATIIAAFDKEVFESMRMRRQRLLESAKKLNAPAATITNPTNSTTK